MLKLARNSLGDMKVCFDEDGNTICWGYTSQTYIMFKRMIFYILAQQAEMYAHKVAQSEDEGGHGSSNHE